MYQNELDLLTQASIPCLFLPSDEGSSKQWEAVHFEGAWVSGISAGGCRTLPSPFYLMNFWPSSLCSGNNLQTFADNPQYLLTLVDHDEDDDDNLCTLIVALMQKNHRSKRKMGLDSLTIGFAIYKLVDGQFQMDNPTASSGFKHQMLSTEFFKYNASVARSPTFINLREVSARFRLAPGQYCIIPSTYEKNEEGEFILRLFTEKPSIDAEENDDELAVTAEEDEVNTLILRVMCFKVECLLDLHYQWIERVLYFYYSFNFMLTENVYANQDEGVIQYEPKAVEIPMADGESDKRRPLIPQPNPSQNQINSNLLVDIFKLLTTCWTILNTADQVQVQVRLNAR